ncbi:MAG: thiamine pyrophosphate-dependent enzyme [Nitrospinaceae bacterium]
MRGLEALEILAPLLGDAPAVLANGYISREFFNVRDRPGNFYMIGSMGLASSIGLGVALARPDRKTVVIDGDGNVLMAMGALAMIGAFAPSNFVHVCLDNEVYESTGRQRTLSAAIALEDVARANGYKKALRVTAADDLARAFTELMGGVGPAFLLVKVEPGFDPARGRVSHTPEEIRDRFMQALGGPPPS